MLVLTAMNNNGAVYSFLIDDVYYKQSEVYANEYLNVLAVLYGDSLDAGIKQLRDYNHMTMQDAEQEIRLRTIMLSGRVLREQRKLDKEHRDAEQALMDRLKRSR